MRSSFSCLAALLLMTPSILFADEPLLLNPNAAKPPVTERRPKTVGLHGDKIEDPYFWLREKGESGGHQAPEGGKCLHRGRDDALSPV